jgi:hypothetical protein
MNALPSGDVLAGESKDRFASGANWTRFLPLVDESRIKAAEYSLSSGSGLFSLEQLCDASDRVRTSTKSLAQWQLHEPFELCEYSVMFA